SYNATSAGKPTKKKSTFRLLKLSKGTIIIDTSGFTGALTSATPSTDNETTCSVVINAQGPVTIVKGTGAYSGLTGTLTLTGRIAIVFPQKGGKCQTNGQPAAFHVDIVGSGTVNS